MDAAHAAFIKKLEESYANADEKDQKAVLERITQECAPEFNEAMSNMFDEFDVDKSGMLDKAEFEGALRVWMPKMSATGVVLLDVLMGTMKKQAAENPNEDFPLDFVLENYGQVQKMLQGTQFVEDAIAASEQILKKLDTNKDGQLSMEEFKAASQNQFSLQMMVQNACQMMR
eukprot:TRINITY_DN14795_c0_g1_i1.p1 TRINITY_DN14795_c0_g1~~TRINITY_DN14795_c0_g1_i1.p1  ORF type:complete len:185 (-),score=45.12 TRINITY_DN14795_c0_g1_i1:206-724(-)